MLKANEAQRLAKQGLRMHGADSIAAVGAEPSDESLENVAPGKISQRDAPATMMTLLVALRDRS